MSVNAGEVRICAWRVQIQDRDVAVTAPAIHGLSTGESQRKHDRVDLGQYRFGNAHLLQQPVAAGNVVRDPEGEPEATLRLA